MCTMPLWSDGGGNIGHASLLREGAGKAVTEETVTIVPLAGVLAEQGIDRVDLVKLDRAYVTAGMEDDAVLADLLERAGNLGAVTVAEGIETTEELDVVRQLGGSLGQGYLFAAPLAPESFLELLISQSERPLQGLSAWLPGGPLARIG